MLRVHFLRRIALPKEIKNGFIAGYIILFIALHFQVQTQVLQKYLKVMMRERERYFISTRVDEAD